MTSSYLWVLCAVLGAALLVGPSVAFNQPGCGVRRVFGVRIIGGLPTGSCEFPWMVEVKTQFFHCAGTILGPRHVMTGATCLRHLRYGAPNVVSPSRVKVFYGSSKRSQLKNMGVVRVHVHPNYENGYFKNDHNVAILTLEKDLVFGECVGPICLPEVGQSPEGMDECVISGWGVTDPTLSPLTQPDTLQKASIPLVSRDVCQRAYGGFLRIGDESKLCAGMYGIGGKDFCRGDTGGPLMCRNGKGPFTQFGIASFGSVKCGKADLPGVYTNVAYPRVLDFIRSSMNDL